MLELARHALRDAETYVKRQQQILADIQQHHVPSAAVAAQLVLKQAEQVLKVRRLNLAYLQSR
jgi:hypothetical protein